MEQNKDTAPASPAALSDGAIREIVNQLRDIAVEFHAAQQLRERIAHVIVPRLQSVRVRIPAGYVLQPIEEVSAAPVPSASPDALTDAVIRNSRGVVKHWNEFGPESDFERAMRGLDAALELLAAQPAAPASEPLEIDRLKSALAEANQSCTAERVARELARDELQRRVEVERKDGSRWFWQGDGHDHLESMIDGMQVIIGAAQLRTLLAATAAPAPADRQGVALSKFDPAQDLVLDEENPLHMKLLNAIKNKGEQQ